MDPALTIKDLAKIAGVSHSTISRALNDSSLVNDVTKDKIQKLASELNFEFNSGARSLKKNKTGVVGVIYFSTWESFGLSLFVNQLFLELRYNLEKYNLDIILIGAYNPETEKSNISRLIRQKKVDSFLIIHPNIQLEDYQLIQESGFPMVHLHIIPNHLDLAEADYFFSNNFKGGQLAATHLLKKNCNKILIIRSEGSEFDQRTKGFYDIIRNSPADIIQEIFIQIDYHEAFNFAEHNKDLLCKIDGVFIQADIMAFWFMTALNELGFKIPHDISIVGYDNSPICLLTNPQLTSISQNPSVSSKHACIRVKELLDENIESKIVQEYIDPEIVVRES